MVQKIVQNPTSEWICGPNFKIAKFDDVELHVFWRCNRNYVVSLWAELKLSCKTFFRDFFSFFFINKLFKKHKKASIEHKRSKKTTEFWTVIQPVFLKSWAVSREWAWVSEWAGLTHSRRSKFEEGCLRSLTETKNFTSVGSLTHGSLTDLDNLSVLLTLTHLTGFWGIFGTLQ